MSGIDSDRSIIATENLSPEEQELLNSTTIESLFYTLILTAEKYHTASAAEIVQTLTLAQATAEQARNLYEDLTDPKKVMEKGVDADTLQQLAQNLIASQEQRKALLQQDEKASVLSKMNYPILKTAILDSWRKNRESGGTPIPEGLIKAFQERRQIIGGKEELVKFAMIVFGEVLTTPQEEATVEFITETVVAEEEKEQPQVVVKKVPPKRGNVFSTWKEVFMSLELSQDVTFSQNYRNAINQVIKKFPERFEKFGHPDDKTHLTDLKGAIETLDDLTVNDLNGAFDINAPRTLHSAARIVSLILRLESHLEGKDAFIPSGELEELTKEIRSGVYTPNTRVCEILREKFSQIFSPGEITEEEILEKEESIEKRNRFPTTDEEIVEHLVNTLKILYDDTESKRGGRELHFPLSTAQVQKFLPRIKQNFVDSMDEKGLVSPNAPSGKESRRYSKLDILKLIILYQYRRGYGVKMNEVKKALTRFEKNLPKAIALYKQRSHGV